MFVGWKGVGLNNVALSMEADLLQEQQKGHSWDRPLRAGQLQATLFVCGCTCYGSQGKGSHLCTPDHRLCLCPVPLFHLCFRSWVCTLFAVTEMWNPLSCLSVGSDNVVHTQSGLFSHRKGWPPTFCDYPGGNEWRTRYVNSDKCCSFQSYAEAKELLAGRRDWNSGH